MFPLNLIYFLLIGLCAGWLAGQLTKGKGFGLAGNLIVGVAGAMLGGLILHLIPETLKDIILATAGAILFLALLRHIGPVSQGRRRR